MIWFLVMVTHVFLVHSSPLNFGGFPVPIGVEDPAPSKTTAERWRPAFHFFIFLFLLPSVPHHEQLGFTVISMENEKEKGWPGYDRVAHTMKTLLFLDKCPEALRWEKSLENCDLGSNHPATVAKPSTVLYPLIQTPRWYEPWLPTFAGIFYGSGIPASGTCLEKAKETNVSL